jgi:hypothetical protein
VRPIPSHDSDGGGIEGNDVIHEGSHAGIDWQPPSISAPSAISEVYLHLTARVIARLRARRT